MTSWAITCSQHKSKHIFIVSNLDAEFEAVDTLSANNLGEIFLGQVQVEKKTKFWTETRLVVTIIRVGDL